MAGLDGRLVASAANYLSTYAVSSGPGTFRGYAGYYKLEAVPSRIA